MNVKAWKRSLTYAGSLVVVSGFLSGLVAVGCSDGDSAEETSTGERSSEPFAFESTESTTGILSGHQANQPSSRFVIPAAVGTPLDRIGRVAASMSEERLGTYTFVQQKPKDGGAFAWRDVAGQQPGPNQIAYVNEGLLALDEQSSGVSVDDFEFAAQIDAGSAVLVVRGDSEAESFPITIDSLEDFVSQVKEEPGVEVADAGPGTVYRAGILEMEEEAGIDLVPRAVEGSALDTLYNGDVKAALIPAEGEALTDILAGELKPLAVFGDRRSPAIPDVPTTGELGYDISVPVFGGIAVPKGTEQRFVDELGREFVGISESSTFERALAGTGRRPVARGPEEFTDYVEQSRQYIEDSTR